MSVAKLQSWVEIDPRALRCNFRFFKKLIGPRTNLMAVIKSNAYGHGLIETAKILKDFNQWFGVNFAEEAFALREASVRNPILILGFTLPTHFKKAFENNIRLSIASLEELKSLATFKSSYKSAPTIHVKIETGFNRRGIQLSELAKAADLIRDSDIGVEGIYTHFSDATNPTSKFWEKQVEKLSKAIAFLRERSIDPRFVHSAATAAAILYPKTYFNMARVGIGLYGYFPSADMGKIKKDMKLKPALNWKTRIIQVKTIKKGESVGYERRFFARDKMKIAILPVGYRDGYARNLSNRGEVLIRKKNCRVLGIVSMNTIVVDITRVSDAGVGDEVILLGGTGKKVVSAFEIAEKSGTIHYEILARINPLIPRIVV